jgi:hypothetical protein
VCYVHVLCSIFIWNHNNLCDMPECPIRWKMFSPLFWTIPLVYCFYNNKTIQPSEQRVCKSQHATKILVCPPTYHQYHALCSILFGTIVICLVLVITMLLVTYLLATHVMSYYFVRKQRKIIVKLSKKRPLLTLVLGRWLIKNIIPPWQMKIDKT